MRNFNKLLSASSFCLLTLVSSHQALAIVNGNRTQKSEAPETVYLGVQADENCTGVVVSPHLILTAGHCIQFLGSANTIGISNQSFKDPTDLWKIQITKKNFHQKYIQVDNSRSKVSVDIQYDIGYIMTSSDLSTMLHAMKLPLIPTDHTSVLSMMLKLPLTTAGYGSGYEKRKLSVSSLGETVDNYFVIKSKEPNKGSCGGDSGSGLFMQDGDKRYLVGILSGISTYDKSTPFVVPKNCGEERERATYVEVSHQLCWLEKETGTQLSDTPLNCP